MPDRRPHPHHPLDCECGVCNPDHGTTLDDVLAEVQRLAVAVDYLRYRPRWQGPAVPGQCRRCGHVDVCSTCCDETHQEGLDYGEE